MFIAATRAAGDGSEAVVKPILEVPELLGVVNRVLDQNRIVIEGNLRILDTLTSPKVVSETLATLVRKSEQEPAPKQEPMP